MPKNTKGKSRAKQKGRDAPQLQHQLVLASWFARQLGYHSPETMLADVKDGGDTDDHLPSPVLGRITSRHDRKITIPHAELAEMDEAIRGDLAKINRRRSPPVRLKYFQYLAALSAEYFLRRRKESADRLASDINAFAKLYECDFPQARFPLCDPSQLSKLAFWMATGSGKTLLMHINYWQSLRHLPFAPNNVLLITPNEDMTAQHLAELRDSDIPCYRHGESGGGFLSARDNAVCVLDIHKLQENPGKQSDTVRPEFFEGPNLVFVDEGHKGAGGKDKGHFEMRGRLAKDGGFTLEYSATFGQAFVRLPERAEKYGRAIAMDYSYYYFYDDGYGKDFFVLNTDGDSEYNEDTMLLGNILSFCQQRLAFDAHPQMMERHNVAAPLLLMLGAEVVGGNKPNEKQKQAQTDIVRIVDFLRRAAADDKWLRQKTAAIVGGRSGMTENGKDIFYDRFKFLRQCCGDDIGNICAAVRQKVFHADAPGALRFSLLKKTGGGDRNKQEISLRIAGNKPFALVRVGDARKLREITARDAPEVTTDENMLQESLFAAINEESSPVNILIGAKMFMEGWSSWRVCGIGLLNVGKGEGPLIIQLFGRGVRLRGFGFSLKRSAAAGHFGGGEEAECLRLLEMLNIFAVRASFMKKFRDYLHREGVADETILVPVRHTPNLPQNLPIPQMPPPGEFDEWAMLDGGKVQINLSSAITIGQGGGTMRQAAAAEHHPCKFNDDICRRINFGALHTRLLEEQNNGGGGIGNIVIANAAQLRKTLKQCSVKTDKNDPLRNFKHDRLQQTAFAALRQAAKNQYTRNLRQWQKAETKSGTLGKKHGNIVAEYQLRLRGGEKELADKIRGIINSRAFSAPRDEKQCDLPRLYYERHLYNPLLLENENEKYVSLSPPGLNKGERKFIDALREHVRGNPPDADICLLRNLPNKDGVGFVLENGGMFYPDFILWLTRGGKTRVVFIEPHGMQFADAYEHDGKARLWEYLRTLSLPFELDSYIVSGTEFDKLHKRYESDWTREKFAEKHILFKEHLHPNAEDRQARDDAFAKLLKPPAQ